MKIFCTHKNKKEIGKYYKVSWFNVWEIEYYRVYKCDDCKKEITKKIYSQAYYSAGSYVDELRRLKSIGFIPYAEYITQ